MDVAPAGVGLPDLDELAAHRLAVAVDDPPGHHGALTDRCTRVLDRQIGVERGDVVLPETGRLQLGGLGFCQE